MNAVGWPVVLLSRGWALKEWAAGGCVGGGRTQRRPGGSSLGTPGALPHMLCLASYSLCSGWIAALSTLKQNLAVSIIMMVAAGFFTLCTALSLFLLKRVSGGCWAASKQRKQAPLPCLHCGGVHRSTVGPPGSPEASSFLPGARWEARWAGATLTQPLAPGALPVPPDRGQLPAGPARVFPGHLQQQDLPQRCLVCCPRSLPGKLVLTVLPLLRPCL